MNMFVAPFNELVENIYRKLKQVKHNMVENPKQKQAYCEIKGFGCLKLSYYVYDYILFVTNKETMQL